MGCLSISTLGSFTVSLDGRPVDSFEYNKIRALLAYLVVEVDRPHRRDALAGLLWPDQSQKAATDSLRNALSKLRQAIGDREADPPHIFITKEETQFNKNSEHWLDVRRFNQLLEECRTHRHRRIECCISCTDRLTQAASLYQGEFLQGFSLADSDLFEDWVRFQREVYLQLAMKALQQLASTYEWRAEYEQALTYSQQLLKLDACHEDAYLQAIRLLGLMGKRTEACELYEKCRKHLQDELDVEPSAETTRLYEQIKYGMFQVSPNRPRINNLPPDLTSFVGRGNELEEINLLLEDPACRLLTLVGPGGVGKTRLAIAVAGRQMDAFPNGGCFVRLAGVSSVESIVPSILQALGLKQSEQGDLKQQLFDYLRDKELILILDNFEHLVEAAGLVSELLEQAPHLITLVTSRQRLGLQAEWTFEVNGLSYPRGKDTQNLASFEAVILFQQRVHQMKPRTTLFQDDLTAVSHICQVVEGLPLGVELAASAVRRRSIEQVATAIESGREDLKVTYKDLPERHRSIRTVFEHSYRLLTPEEQSAFIGLAVFRGGFTPEAAEQVAGTNAEILDSLVEHSLVRYDPEKERYDLHELVRQFALEKQKSQGDETILRNNYSCYYLQALERWNLELEGAGQVAALQEMDQEISNIKNSWEWACQHKDLEGLSRGGSGLCRFYIHRSQPIDGEHLCQDALDMLMRIDEPNPLALRLIAQLTLFLRTFQLQSGRIDGPTQQQMLERSLQILEGLQRAGEDVWIDITWVLRAKSAVTTDLEQAVQIAEQSLDIARQTNHKRSVALALSNLAKINFNSGKFEVAEHYSQGALSEWRMLGDPLRIAGQLLVLSEIYANMGRMDNTLQTVREGSEILISLGDRVGYLEGLAVVAWNLRIFRQWEESEKLYKEILPQLQLMGNHVLLCSTTAGYCENKLLFGDYEEARVMAEHNLELENQINDIQNLDFIHGELGMIALAQGRLEKAADFLKMAADLCIQNGYHFYLASVLGIWSLVHIRMGQLRQGLELLIEALQKGTLLHSRINISYTLPAAAYFLAISGMVERALELSALIDEQAFCGKTPWFEDVAGKQIKEMATSLPPEVMEAAIQRGRQRDLFVTAAELLKEFTQSS